MFTPNLRRDHLQARPGRRRESFFMSWIIAPPKPNLYPRRPDIQTNTFFIFSLNLRYRFLGHPLPPSCDLTCPLRLPFLFSLRHPRWCPVEEDEEKKGMKHCRKKNAWRGRLANLEPEHVQGFSFPVTFWMLCCNLKFCDET